MKRPITVSIIAWCLIAWSIILLLNGIQDLRVPLFMGIMPWSLYPWDKNPIMAVEFINSWVGVVVYFVVGIFMLKGQGWSRYAYPIWYVYGLVIGYIAFSSIMAWVGEILVVIVITVLLFLPKSNAYFSKTMP